MTAHSKDDGLEEFGLPWQVEPWGDGSKPPYVNICSESHAAVVAADLERDVANWIVAMANGFAAERAVREALENYMFAEEIDDPAVRQSELAVAREQARAALSSARAEET